MKPFTNKHSIAAGSPLHKDKKRIVSEDDKSITVYNKNTDKNVRVDKRSDIYKSFYKDKANQGTDFPDLASQHRT